MMNNSSLSCERVTQWRSMVIVDLSNSPSSWLRHSVSGNYHNSRPNRRIFREYWIHIVGWINNPGPSLGYVIRDVQMGLRRWLVIPWEARVIDQCDFLSSWFRRAVSGNYYGSHPNWRIFQKFAILIVWGVNNSGFFLRRMPRGERVYGEYRFPGLIA